MKTLKDLFEHLLQDLYSAENQLIEALPKTAKNANNPKLKEAFENHLEETKGHKERLEEVFEILGLSSKEETCKAMKGLIEEVESFIKEAGSEEVMDAGLIAQAQRIEHYEISGYGTLVQYAKELGHNDIAKKLQKTLDEEYNADNKLNKLAESRINENAIS